MSLEERFLEVMVRIPPYLPAEIRDEFLAILQVKSLLTGAAVALAAWVASHYFGIGWIISGILLATGLIFIGVVVFQAAEDFLRALDRVVRASREKDLEDAARLMARFIAVVGVSVFMMLLARAAKRAAVRKRAAQTADGTNMGGRAAATPGGDRGPGTRAGSPGRPSPAPPPRALSRIPTSNVPLRADPDRTTTVLGSYQRDTKHIIEEIRYPKTEDFGPRKGDFNLLNVPDNKYRNPQQFWEEYNKPFLDRAIDRRDVIAMATRPNNATLNATLPDGSVVRSGFGREYDYLLSKGYRYDPLTSTMVK